MAMCTLGQLKAEDKCNREVTKCIQYYKDNENEKKINIPIPK